MLIFTVRLLGSGETFTSLVITYPSHVAAGTLLALGVEASRAIWLTSQDKHALRTRQALSIPPADFIYYLDVNSEPKKHMRLFQAHYAVQELSQDGWMVMTSLLPRTRSVVLCSAPTDRLDEDVLSPLLIHLRQLEIAPEKVLFTICVPTQRGLPCSQQQMMNILVKRQILKPRFFGLVVKDRNELGEAYRQACPNFWNKAQGEFAELRLVSCALGNADNARHSGLARAFQECPWGEYVDLPPRRAVEMARFQDMDGLLALQANDGQSKLLLSTLMNVALHSDDSAERLGVINVWNQVDRVVGTDWLLPLLADDGVSIRQAVVDAVCSRLPRSIERLVNMALDEGVDRHDGAREAIIRVVDDCVVGLLIDALDSAESSRRRRTQDLLVQLGEQSQSALVARMVGGAYQGRIGAALVLARLRDGRAQQFLEAEFRRTKSGSRHRRIVQEGFETWNPQLFRRLIEEEVQREVQEQAERRERLRRLAGRGFRVALGAIILLVSGLVLDAIFQHRPDAISELAWSPDGRYIAYVGVESPFTLGAYKYYYFIYRIDSGGSRSTLLAEYGRNTCSELQWISRGLSFLVRNYSSGETNVAILSPYVEKVDISAFWDSLIKAQYEYNPSLSPDGQRIAFISCRGSEPRECHIYNTAVDNSDLRRLTPVAFSPPIPFALTWSPDGQRIAFLVNESSSLYVVNADGTGMLEIARDAVSDWKSWPSWSPDGERIAYTSEEGIKIIRFDGTENSLLASGDYHAPVWSPNGQHIAFAANQTVMVVDIGTLETACLSCDSRIKENRLRDFAWSPDAHSVAFAYSQVDEKFYWLEGGNIYLADVNTHSVRLLTGSLLQRWPFALW